MPIFNKVNGEQKQAWALNVKIGDSWRPANQYVKVDGEWKLSHSHSFDPVNNIIGFRLIYKRCNTNKKYDALPHLNVNYNIPCNMRLTGDITNEMNMNQKGVVFEYSNKLPDEEGILMYEGVLYALCSNGQLIDICNPTDTEERIIINNIPTVTEVWRTNRFPRDMKIILQGYLLYESNGFNFFGWNSLLSNNQFIDNTTFPTDLDKNIYEMNSYNILPITDRDYQFSEFSSIGIARDIHSDINMVGSYGILDHTIYWIKVNDIKKPFVIEVYE